MEEILGSLKDGDRLVDSVLMHMGSMYSKLGKYDKSLHMYERAVDIFANKYGNLRTLFNCISISCTCLCALLFD